MAKAAAAAAAAAAAVDGPTGGAGGDDGGGGDGLGDGDGGGKMGGGGVEHLTPASGPSGPPRESNGVSPIATATTKREISRLRRPMRRVPEPPPTCSECCTISTMRMSAIGTATSARASPRFSRDPSG